MSGIIGTLSTTAIAIMLLNLEPMLAVPMSQASYCLEAYLMNTQYMQHVTPGQLTDL